MECVPFTSLLPERQDQCVRVRASRVWYYHGGLEDGAVTSIHMVLLDEEGNHVYAVVPTAILDAHLGNLHETALYTLTNFQVLVRRPEMSPVDSSMMIRFTLQTTVQPVFHFDDWFPECTYKLTSFEDAPNTTPARFIDVIGIIRGISDIATSAMAGRNVPTSRRCIFLTDSCDREITVNLWGDAAFRFNGESIQYLGQEEPAVAIFVGMTVQLYEDSKQLAGSAACRWYVNEDLPDINVLRSSLFTSFQPVKKFPAPPITMRSQIAGQYPERTLVKLLNHDFFRYGDGKFRCNVRVWRLVPGTQWWFLSCAMCKRMAFPGPPSSVAHPTYACSSMNCSSSEVVITYRLSLLGFDGTGEAEFTLLGKVAEHVVGLAPIQLIRKNYQGELPITNLCVAAAQMGNALPELAAIASRRYKFLINVTANSFLSKWPRFSVHVVEGCYPLE